MKSNTLIDKAREYAKRVHTGQKDDAGQDYFKHLEQVALMLSVITTDPDVIAAGYLHDTIEDTSTSFNDLVREFNPRIAGLVHEVTHESLINEGWYFPRLRTRDAILIKFADRLSNLSRMEPWTEQRQKHYLKKSKFWRTE